MLLDHPARPIDYEQVQPTTPLSSHSSRLFRLDVVPSSGCRCCAMQGWQLQKECLGRVQQFAEAGQLGHDYLILLQHNPVYTLGTSPLGHESSSNPGAVDCNKPGCIELYRIQVSIPAVHRRWQQRGACEV